MSLTGVSIPHLVTSPCTSFGKAAHPWDNRQNMEHYKGAIGTRRMRTTQATAIAIYYARYNKVLNSRYCRFPKTDDQCVFNRGQFWAEQAVDVDVIKAEPDWLNTA